MSAFRIRDAAAVAEGIHEHLEQNEAIALHALDTVVDTGADAAHA